jgi:hypothetical protein
MAESTYVTVTRPLRAVWRAILTITFILIMLIGYGKPAEACPVCDTGTGRAVRRGLFNEGSVKNLMLTALPFPFFFGITAFLYYGPPPLRRRTRSVCLDQSQAINDILEG